MNNDFTDQYNQKRLSLSLTEIFPLTWSWKLCKYFTWEVIMIKESWNNDFRDLWNPTEHTFYQKLSAWPLTLTFDTIKVLQFPHQAVETAWLQRNTRNLIYEGPVILLSCSYIKRTTKT